MLLTYHLLQSFDHLYRSISSKLLITRIVQMHLIGGTLTILPLRDFSPILAMDANGGEVLERVKAFKRFKVLERFKEPMFCVFEFCTQELWFCVLSFVLKNVAFELCTLMLCDLSFVLNNLCFVI